MKETFGFDNVEVPDVDNERNDPKDKTGTGLAGPLPKDARPDT